VGVHLEWSWYLNSGHQIWWGHRGRIVIDGSFLVRRARRNAGSRCHGGAARRLRGGRGGRLKAEQEKVVKPEKMEWIESQTCADN
jgi:hypothetical protein